MRHAEQQRSLCFINLGIVFFRNALGVMLIGWW